MSSAANRRTRVAAYAVIIRGEAGREEILLSRLAPYLTADELWTLPGGGVEFGEEPRAAVVREVHEETGLAATVGDEAWVDSQVVPTRPRGDDVDDARHAIRLVYEGWVAKGATEPHVVEVDGSTADAAWQRVADVLAGTVPTVPVVRRALERFTTHRHQRLAAYGLVLRGDEVLLTRISPLGVAPGTWTLPGGGVDHGESPAAGLEREITEETGLRATVGRLLGVHDAHFTGTAPSGRVEDFHGVHLVFEVTVDEGEPGVVEVDGTTDAVAWVPVAEVGSERRPVFDLVRAALDMDR